MKSQIGKRSFIGKRWKEEKCHRNHDWAFIDTVEAGEEDGEDIVCMIYIPELLPLYAAQFDTRFKKVKKLCKLNEEITKKVLERRNIKNLELQKILKQAKAKKSKSKLSTFL